MKNCPRCGLPIGDTTTACSCGWKDRKTKRPHDEPELPIECAHIACQQRAKVNIKTPTGRANLCTFHYDEHYRLKTLDTCAALGLHTSSQRREHAKSLLRSNPMFRNLERLYQTEPGEDWSEAPHREIS